MDNPDLPEKRIRFGCGAVFGVALAPALWSLYASESWATSISLTALGALLCGFMAMRHGDRFWEWFRDQDWHW